MAWIFGTGCTKLEYRLELSMRVAPLRVWKCLKVPEAIRHKWNRLYCTCILLALLRIHESIFERVCCLPKIKTTKGSMGISIEQHRRGLALMTISWKQRISCHVLRNIFGVKCLWCSTDLNVFYLPVLKQVQVLGKQKCGMMWRFDFHKWVSTSNKNNVLTTVKEIKYPLVKMLVSNV